MEDKKVLIIVNQDELILDKEQWIGWSAYKVKLCRNAWGNYITAIAYFNGTGDGGLYITPNKECSTIETEPRCIEKWLINVLSQESIDEIRLIEQGSTCVAKLLEKFGIKYSKEF